MWRKVDVYNAFLLEITNLLYGNIRNVELRDVGDQKIFRLGACAWDSLTHVELVNKINYLLVVFRFCRTCDMEKDNPQGVFFKRLGGYHLEYPDLYKARGPYLLLPTEIFQPSKRCTIKNYIALCDVTRTENIKSIEIANHILATMKYCGEKWKTAARGHAAYLESLKEGILKLLQ